MRTLVTGGAGFIGSHLVEGLLHAGYAVRVLDSFVTGHRKNLASICSDIEVIEGDIRDMGCVRRAIEGVDVVFHLAAAVSVAASVEDPLATSSVNGGGTLNVLVAARDVGVPRVVLASSSSVYGDTPMQPNHEEMVPNPESPYAITKLLGELYCRSFFRLYGMETLSLRYFNVFGPRQDPKSQYSAVIPKFIADLCHDHRPVIYGDGGQSRDFVYVENVVHANLLAASVNQGFGETFNIGSGQAMNLADMYSHLARLTGSQLEPEYADPRPGDIRHSLADITKAQNLLKYRPLVDPRDGLKRTVEWFMNDRRAAA